MIGATIGRVIDDRVIGSLSPARQLGPRLDGLKIQGTAEGAPMACVFGRARVAGQVIWAARFLEGKVKGRAGKGGPRTVDYAYSLSFAVALCEGEIDGIGRVWADGRLMELNGVAMRVHRGGEDQRPDPLIEAVEQDAPAYRGVAYVVFEDLPLGPFGDRVPQLSFEVFRRPRGAGPRLEDRLEGVCLIPGAGEFALATEAVVRREGLTRTTAENVHNGEGRADLIVSLGSCGSRVLEHACVYQASSVAYRDMDASPLGFPKGVTPLLNQPAVLPLPCPVPGLPTARLSTGANVVSGVAYDAIDAEMVDMETWALVRAAQTFGLPLIALRGVSDGRSELKALEDWTSTLCHVDENLAAALDRLIAVLEADGLAALEIPALHGQDPAQPPAPDSITP